MHTTVIHLLMICHKPNGDHLRLIRHRLETPRVMYLSTSDMFRTWFGYPNLAGSDFPNLVRIISPKMQTEVTPRSPTQHNLSQTKWLPFTDEQTQLGGFRSDISQIMMKYWYKSIKNGGFSRFSIPRWGGDKKSHQTKGNIFPVLLRYRTSKSEPAARIYRRKPLVFFLVPKKNIWRGIARIPLRK